MYVKGERERGGEWGISYVLPQITTSILSFRQTQLDLRLLNLWDMLYFCHELSASEKHRRKRGTVNREENTVIKGTSKPFKGRSKQLPFWIVLAFDSLEMCSALTSSPSEAVTGRGETQGKDCFFCWGLLPSMLLGRSLASFMANGTCGS